MTSNFEVTIRPITLPNGIEAFQVGTGLIFAAFSAARRYALCLVARAARKAVAIVEPVKAPEAVQAPAVEPKKLTLRQRAMTCRIGKGKPAVSTIAPVAKVSAIEWIAGILGRFASVATEAQRAMAIALRNEDFISGLMIEPIGPSLSELAARI